MKLYSKTIQRIGLVAIVILMAGFAMFVKQHKSQAAISNMLNFAGKVTNVDGSEVTDGNYDFVYSIYNVSSGGTALWTETLNAANVFSATIGSYDSGTFTYTYTGETASSTLRIGQHLTNAVTGQAVLITAFDTDAKTITVVDGAPTWSVGQAINTRPYVEGGVIDVNLGSVSDLGVVDFGQPLYLEITFNGEVMQPRKILTSVAQAFNADMLDGYHASEFANLADDSIVTGEWTFSNILSVATSSSETALSITQSGTGDIINLIGNLGQEVFTIIGTGEVGIGTSTPVNKLDIVGDIGIRDQNDLRLYELSANGTNYVGFRASSTLTSDLIWTLPTTAGTLGQALMVNANGDLEWGTASEGAVSAGLAGQFPYYAASGDTLTATSSLFLAASGNLGIGNSTPLATLDVNGDLRVASKDIFDGNNSQTSDGDFSTGTNSSTQVLSGDVVLGLDALNVGASAHTVYNTADGASSVFTVDVDSDGDMDIISGSTSDFTVRWYENNGSESFTAHNVYVGTAGVYSVGAADFDGDGDIDIISASYGDDTIRWYENNGSESFTARIVYAAADGADTVYAADIDSDGDIDIVSGAQSDNTVRWHSNNGTGSFTTYSVYSAALIVTSVYAADIDGDLDMDILSASFSDGDIRWYENNGAEAFTVHTIFGSASYAFSVYAADVDSDGNMDVLSASSNDNTIRWYKNNGSEVFTAYTVYASAGGARSVYAADMDGDGDVDILSASVTDNAIRWYENNGAELFTSHSVYTTATGAQAVYVSDLDGDGDNDILSASGSDDTIRWYETTGGGYLSSGTFTSSAIDSGQTTPDFTTLSLNITEETGVTNIQFRLRSADTTAGLTSATWYGPTGTSDYYTTSGEAINSIHDSDRYIQLQAYLSTTDIAKTPYLHDFTINYEYNGGVFSVSNSGLVTSGSWNGSEITVAYGGTGLTNVNDGYFLIGTGGTALEATSSMYMANNGYIGMGTTTPAHQLSLTGNLQLSNTTFAAQYGVIYKNGSRFIHDFNYGNNGTVTTNGNNTFVGINSGNFTSGSTATAAVQASYNTGVGYFSLNGLTTGNYNSALGNTTLSGNTTGAGNSAVGYAALYQNSIGNYNTAIGHLALGANTSGAGNIALGVMAGYYTSATASNSASNNSVYLGYNTRSLSSGVSNEIVIGYNAVGIGSNTAVLGSNSITTTMLNGNVGIGTSTPLTKLHVVGGDLVTRPAMNTSDVLLIENSADKATTINLLSSFNTSSNIAFSNEYSNGAGSIGYIPSAYMMTFNASGTTPLAVSGNGNVGIGTSTNPEVALHVHKGNVGATRPVWSSYDVALFENTATYDSIIQILAGNTRSSGIGFSDNDTRNIGSIMYNHANNSMAFRTNSTLGMTIANTGYVGIGTTNPLSTLSLQGTAGQSVFSIASSTGSSIFFIDAYGKIGIGTNVPDSALNISSDSGAQLKLEYTGSSHAATFTVDSAGLFTIESNEPGDVYIDPTSKLGVGTSSPTSALSVYGDVFIEGDSRYVNFGTVVGTSGYGIRDNSGTLQIKNSGTEWTNVALIGTGNTGWVPRYYGNTNYLEATSTMYISNAGYVGIGVTNPTSQLALGGNIDMNNHDITEIGRLDVGSTYGYGLRFNNSNNSMITWGNDATHQFGGVGVSSIKLNTGETDNGSGVTFGPYGLEPTASINSSGTLTLGGYAYIGGARLTLSETSGRASSSILVQTSQGIPFLEFATSTGEVFMFVNKDGWLGLNTNTPDTFLHVGSANPDKVGSGENAYVEGSVEIDNILYVDGVATSTFVGSLDIGRNVQMTNTTFASPYGITFKNGSRFIHDFNYGSNSLVTTDGANTFVGINSGNFTSGSTATLSYHSSQNTGFGNSTLTSITTGYGNTALGSLALFTNDTAAGNTAVGAGAMYFTTSGGYNTALGTGAMYSNVSGINNTASGRFALFNNVSGNYNIAEGYNSGMYIAGGSISNTTSDYSIYIGALAKALADDDQNEIVIGYDATGLGSDSVVLGNDSIVTTALKGNVGIGTTTPTAKLYVVNSTAGDADNIFVIASSSDVFRVTGGGDVYADGSFIDTGADYAEYFFTNDNNLSAGEVVCVDVTENNAVRRCERASDGNVMGIVSTQPAIIGNARPGYAKNKNYAIVGMLGQVPAKVSDENGSIRPGDSLTSASLAGYIMKANAGDSTVGVALETFGNQTASGTPSVVSTGEIKVLISRRNKSLTVEMVESTITEHIADMEIEDEVQILIANAVNNLDLGNEIQPIVDEQINLFDQRLTVEFDSYDNRLTTIAASIDSLSARMGLVESGITSIGQAQLRADSQISDLNERLILMEAGNYNLEIIKVDANSGLVITDNEYRDMNEPTVSVVEIETATTTEKTAFVVNQLGNGDVVDFQADGISIVNIADNGKVSVVGEMSVDGRLMVCSGAGCGSALDDAVDGTMGDMGVEGKVVAGAFESVCDEGFVWVPGSAKYGTMPGFCVMDNEARNGENNIPSIDAGNMLWANVSQGEAQLACQTMGDNYHLINENEWLTIAENIIRVSENDIDANTAGLQLSTASSTEFTLSNGNVIYNLAGSLREWTDMIVTRAGLIAPTSEDWQEYHSITDFKGYNIAPP
ncbi:MAG: FG-GAP-like repeat-containing protein, partial [Candidatus Saccharibacteria bacterium]|nr:FG-GAP-like repeat-containing protein [Candidatus Saccharibacteria bacterium]